MKATRCLITLLGVLFLICPFAFAETPLPRIELQYAGNCKVNGTDAVAVSPDDSQVAYIASMDSSKKKALFLRPVAGHSQAQRLLATDENLYQIVWSSAGDRIVVNGYSRTFVLSKKKNGSWTCGALDTHCLDIGLSLDGRILFGLDSLGGGEYKAIIATIERPQTKYDFQVVPLPPGVYWNSNSGLVPRDSEMMQFVSTGLAIRSDGAVKDVPPIGHRDINDWAVGPIRNGYYLSIAQWFISYKRGRRLTRTTITAQSQDGQHTVPVPWDNGQFINSLQTTRNSVWIEFPHLPGSEKQGRKVIALRRYKVIQHQ